MILMDKLIKSLDNGDYVIGVFLEFYVIHGRALSWF